MERAPWLKRLFGPRLDRHVIEIPPGPAGQPGERLRAPARSVHPPATVEPEGGRRDFRFAISRGNSSLGALCIGRVEDHGEPRTAASESAARYEAEGAQAAQVSGDTVAGEAAWSVRAELPDSVVVDWLFAHRGWLFVAGVVIRGGDDEEETVARARAVLDTWEWLEAPG